MLIIGLMLLSGITAHATVSTTQTGGTAGAWNYTLSNGEATEVNCTTTTLSGTVTVPTQLDGYNVTSIGDINGSGTVFDYTCYITSVIIPDGVTSINDSAFFYSVGLTSVTIPSSVTSISAGAFYGCRGLTSITIPSSVTSIGQSAFSGCWGLTSVTVPSSVTSISTSAFYGCTGLTSITIPNSVTSIGQSAFYGCSKLTSITIPSSVTSIGQSAFQGCTGLTSVTIPNAVTSIGGSAFYGCTGLTSITVPSSVTSIGQSAFQGCTGLTSMTIPNTVTSIGSSAFQSCTGLASITIPSSVTSIDYSAFSGCTGLTTITIPDSVTSIGSGAFSYCSGLISITIPNSVTSIGGSAFYGVNVVVLKSDSTMLLNVPTTYTSYTVPSSVTSIGDGAFYNCTKLTSITIPNSVTSIGESAFQGCSELSSITIPNSVTSISRFVFYGCSKLTSITIPSTVTSLGERTFYQCTNLASVNIPSSVTSIGYGAFLYCAKLTSVIIPNSVTSIGAYAFSYCSGLTSITMPSSVMSIGDGAFNYCPGSGANHIIIPKNIQSIGTNAFGNTRGVYYYASNTVAATAATSYTGAYAWTAIDETAPTAPNVVCFTDINSFVIYSGVDTGSGVASTQYQINGGEWTTFLAPVSVDDGNYTISAKTVDKQGNESVVISVSMTAYKDALNAATTSVTTAETTKTQTDVNTAKSLIPAIPDGNAKTNLQSRVDVVQAYIDAESAYTARLVTATTAVVTAEASKSQANVDTATALVVLLNESDAAPLTARLEAVQIYINNKAQFDAAETAVVTAEKYKLDYYTSKALSLVNALPEGDGKVALLLRLEAVQSGVDPAKLNAAIDAVEKVEADKTQEAIDAAKVLISALPSTTTKTDLTTRLNAIILETSESTSADVASAVIAVEIVESSGLQADFVVANTAVSALSDSNAKTLLVARLNTILSVVKATSSVVTAETSKTMETYNAANTAVSALSDGTLKAALQTRLAALLTTLYGGNAGTAVATATAAVEKAEKYKTTYYYNSALTWVNGLTDSVVKTHLISRLTAIAGSTATTDTAVATATSAVVNAEKYKTQYYIDKAQTLVTALTDSDAKTSLQARLDTVKASVLAEAVIIATVYVSKAEAAQIQANVNTALKYVTALSECAEKTALLARISAVQATIDATLYTQNLASATTSVITAEAKLTAYYYEKALALVNLLPERVEKTDLLNRLADVKATLDIKALASATTAVERAEKYLTTSYYNAAVAQASALVESAGKTALQERLAIVNAIMAVKTAESSKSQASVDSAMVLIDALANNVAKTALQARLAAIVIA